MSSTPPADLPVALHRLRSPIEAFAPRNANEEQFRSSMLGLADLLEELWSLEGDETLESEVIWTALHAFPALVVHGPTPDELVEMMLGGQLLDAETADLLSSLGQIQRVLRALEPPGVAAAMWRAVLLSVLAVVELLALVAGKRGKARCFELLDMTEAMADRFSGAA